MTNPADIAAEMSKPGTFNLIERLQNRNMPEEDVDVYLDERLGFKLVQLEEAYNEAKTDDAANAILNKIDAVREELKASRYIFTMRGMSNETYDAIVDEVNEQIPEEFDEVTNPYTQQVVKVAKPNDERVSLYNTLFLAESLVKVTDPDGNVDDDITPEKVVLIKRLAPVDAIRMLLVLAEKMRMTAEWMEAIQDEDFSPKP